MKIAMSIFAKIFILEIIPIIMIIIKPIEQKTSKKKTSEVSKAILASLLN
jgi:hypothetical protein